jgi:hypothetical protein
VAWKKARPPPRTPEEAARFVVQTLKNHQKADVEVRSATPPRPAVLIAPQRAVDDNGSIHSFLLVLSQGLLVFYGLPIPSGAATAPAPHHAAPSKPQGAKLELHTLPVRLPCPRPAAISLIFFLSSI